MNRRARAVVLVVIGALVATTTCASQADYGPEALDPPALVYVHDALGRLHMVGDPEGEAAVYRYDAVGDILSVSLTPSDELSVVDVVPPRARPGAEVVVSGTGFDERRSRNTVTFGEGEDSVEAEVVEAGRFELTVVVPEDATSGPIEVETSGSTATSSADFEVEPDRRPVIESVSPTTVAAGDEVRIEGRNFTGDPLLDIAVIGGTTYATVTEASETTLVATVPPTAPSGRVSVATPHGTVRSDETLVVAPLGYPASSVGGLRRADIGESIDLELSDQGAVELVTFEGRRGEAVSLSLSASTGDDRLACPDVAIGLGDPTGVELADPRAPLVTLGTAEPAPWCADGDGGDRSRPILLPATGLYTLTVEPRGARTGPVDLTLHDADPPGGDHDGGTGDGGTGPEDDGAAGAIGESSGRALNEVADAAGAAPTAQRRSGGDGEDGVGGADGQVTAGVGGPLDGFGWLPVDLGSGALVLQETDMVVADVLPVALTRSYSPAAGGTGARMGEFGLGSALELDLRLRPSPALQYVQLLLPDGLPVVFDRTTDGTDRDSAVFEHRTTPTGFFGATVTWSGIGWDLRLPEGTTLEFAPDGPLRALRDANGNATTIRRDDAVDAVGPTVADNVASVHSPTGRWLAFAYDDQDRIVEARNHLGDTAAYRYDADGRLAAVSYEAGRGDDEARFEVGYAYDDQGRVTVVDRRSGGAQVRATIAYDTAGRVVSQRLADGTSYSFAYATGPRPTGIDGVEIESVTRARVTDPRGNVRRVTFDAGGRWVTDTFAAGSADEQQVTASRDPDTGFVTTSVAAGGPRSGYRYDGDGNVVELTAAAAEGDGGTGDASGGDDLRAELAYDPASLRPASITSPAGLRSGLSYDDAGNLAGATTPAGGTTSFEHDRRGRLTSITDAEGSTTAFTYELGHRVTATDPLGRTITEFYDAAGQLAARTGPTGTTTTYGYDAFGRLRSATGPLGDRTALAVDAAGNVGALEDAGGNTTSYTYDDLGRVTSRTDPDGATDRLEYDAMGNVVAHVDRRGVRSQFAYDDLGRLVRAAYGVDASCRPESAESTVAYQYAASGRLVRVDDSGYGTITLGYDGLGRLVRETTPQGAVEYAYDACGRRTSTVVDSGTPITYGYDADSGLLTKVAHGSTEVALAHDRLGRVSRVELPNDVEADATYDAGGALTGLDYTVDDHDLGDLLYRHDAAGRRRAVGGTLAPSALPDASDSADQELTYDAAGNLTSDGERTYEWDARGRLVAISSEEDGEVQARFAYDPFGRRTEKSVDGEVTSYTYDGQDVVRTRSGDSAALYLSGPGLDDLYARVTDGADGEVTTYVTDAQGSVLGLVGPGSDGELATRYDYDPFGRTTRHGEDDPNPFTYTGRELDESGLLFVRARYYSPEQGRFVSQDPIGFAGGDPNLYAYAGNDPVDLTDPLGLQAGNIAAALACAAGASYWMAVVTENVDTFLDILDPDNPVPITSDESQVELDRINRENLAALEVWLTVCNIAFSFAGLGGLVSRGATSFGRTLATRFPTAATRLTTRFPSLAPRLGLEATTLAPRTTPLALNAGPRPFGELTAGPQPLGALGPGPPELASGPSLLSIETRQGAAMQSVLPEAIAARSQVEGGAILWRVGTTTRSAGPEAQFWAMEHPWTAGYVQRYGLPPQNVAQVDFIEMGILKPGTPFITRPAVPVGPNPGGAIEAVVPEGGVQVCGFSFCGPKGVWW